MRRGGGWLQPLCLTASLSTADSSSLLQKAHLPKGRVAKLPV